MRREGTGVKEEKRREEKRGEERSIELQLRDERSVSRVELSCVEFRRGEL